MNRGLRAWQEIEHGKLLASKDPELAWGWGTPSGRLRAKRRSTLIASGAKLGPGVKALEIGCGTGMFTEMFAQTGARIFAVDISEDLLAKARERKLPADRVTFIHSSFEDCGVNGPFDAVIGSSILHHLDPDAAVPKIYELLKPGGLMSFTEPNLLNPQAFVERKFKFLRSWFWYVTPGETAFIRWRLRSQLGELGFENIEITPFDWLHPATPESMIDLVSRLSQFLERVPVVREFAGSLHIRCRRPYS